MSGGRTLGFRLALRTTLVADDCPEGPSVCGRDTGLDDALSLDLIVAAGARVDRVD